MIKKRSTTGGDAAHGRRVSLLLPRKHYTQRFRNAAKTRETRGSFYRKIISARQLQLRYRHARALPSTLSSKNPRTLSLARPLSCSRTRFRAEGTREYRNTHARIRGGCARLADGFSSCTHGGSLFQRSAGRDHHRRRRRRRCTQLFAVVGATASFGRR